MNAEELLDLGLTWQFKGDLAKAEDYLKKALAQDPELRGAHLALGDIYLKRGRIDMAEDMYSKEIKILLKSGVDPIVKTKKQDI